MNNSHSPSRTHSGRTRLPSGSASPSLAPSPSGSASPSRTRGLTRSGSVSPLIAGRARGHRFNLTPSEAALWRALSGRRCCGIAFRRQVPIAGCRFIADFLAPAERLIVEVDGGYHRDRVRADARRDEKLRRLGYRVVRVAAEDVMRNLPRVLARLEHALGAAC